MFQQILVIGTLFFYCAFAQSEFQVRERHPDVGLRVPELVTKYGYPIEIHTVETKDHYVLTLHRIPHGKNNANDTNKPVIYLQHGLLCSSADWVLMGPEKGLAYLLANVGYDVWMGNARGNFYSRNNTIWDPDHDKAHFWDFSWHEIGNIDLPTMIDYVLEKTGETQLSYIGHSQGTTTFFVMTSTLPEYNDKIKLMVALAPVAYMAHVPNLAIKLIAKFINSVHWISSMLGAYEFLPSTKFMQELAALVCDDESIIQDLCSNILFLIAGSNKEQLNATMVPVILSNTPAGAATKQIVHYGQLVNSKKFRQYDYGLLNCVHYEFCTIPEYNLAKITSPVASYRGTLDLLTAKEDVDKLRKELSHSILHKEITFSHLDFLWANDVVKLLYNDVIDLVGRYNKV